MKGFIRPRGDAWELRLFLGTDPVTNNKRYASIHGILRRALGQGLKTGARGLECVVSA